MFSLLLYSKGYLDCCLCWLWFASSRINDFTHEIFESCQGSSRSRSNPPRVCESYPGSVPLYSQWHLWVSLLLWNLRTSLWVLPASPELPWSLRSLGGRAGCPLLSILGCPDLSLCPSAHVEHRDWEAAADLWGSAQPHVGYWRRCVATHNVGAGTLSWTRGEWRWQSFSHISGGCHCFSWPWCTVESMVRKPKGRNNPTLTRTLHCYPYPDSLSNLYTWCSSQAVPLLPVGA